MGLAELFPGCPLPSKLGLLKESIFPAQDDGWEDVTGIKSRCSLTSFISHNGKI